MSTLIDTNILLRLSQLNHPLHQTAVDALTVLRAQGDALYLVSQVLYESWVASTRPLAQNGLGMTPSQAATELANYKSRFPVFDDTPAVRTEWDILVTQHQVVGKKAHDARLVAAMHVHRIPRLLTFNKQDFQRFPGIVVISPQDVVQSQTPPQAGQKGPIP